MGIAMSVARSASAVLIALTLAAHAGGQTPDWPALVQQPHERLKIEDFGLQPLLRDAAGQPIAAAKAWDRRRGELLEAWRARLGPEPKKPADLAVRVHETTKSDGYERRLVSFHSADGDRLEAYLLVPDDLKPGEKRAAVVVFHQTSRDMHREPVGLGKNKSLALGVHLVKRGYVVLCPQCFILKDGWARAQAEAIAKKWPGWTGMGKMTFDASRCLDFLASLGFVDMARVGCIGHSLGAKEVLYALAFEPRYAVGVFSEGGIGLGFSNWFDGWYLTEKMKKHVPALEHHQVMALAAPRPLLIVGGDSADGDRSWSFVHAALPVYRLLGAGDRLGMINHRQGHTFPLEARRLSYRWLDHWLRHRPTRDEAGE